jgi:hypothetical protein
MAREPYEKNMRVHWVPTISNIQAPTVAEITAGKYWGTAVTKDGVAVNVTQNGVDTAAIDTDFDSEIGGSWAAKPEVTFMRDGVTETNFWDFITRGTAGYLVIRAFGASGVAVIGDKAQVYPAEMGQVKPSNSAANEAQKFTCQFFVTAEPAMKAVVA